MTWMIIARKIFHEITGLKLTLLRRDQNFMFGMNELTLCMHHTTRTNAG
jgi:hypothetical protein